MDATLILSLLTLATLYWLHRRALARAYAAGWTDARTEQDRQERHGLAVLPEEQIPTT
jgi:hypothetical protein